MQEDKTLQQLIREHETNMPPEIMNLINSFDWKKELRTIVNQNQLMIDVGADLEEGIYLMLLGALEARDLYDQLTEGYQIPEDKARKILEEVENMIFSPLFKKLTMLDEKEQKPSSSTNLQAKSNAPRDQILAEIEKEPEPLIKVNFNKTAQTQAPKVEFREETNSGIVKPFSIDEIQTVSDKVNPAFSMPKTDLNIKSNEEIKKNPIEVGITTPTVTANPAQIQKNYAADPYREPIE